MMPQRRRRRWWVVTAGAVVATSIGVAVVALEHKHSPDCAAVQAVADDADRFFSRVTHDINAPAPASTGDYPGQVALLDGQAAHIRDPGLAGHARAVADLASQIATLVPRVRDGKLPGHAPDQSAQEFTIVTSQFSQNLDALAKTCPDSVHRVHIG